MTKVLQLCVLKVTLTKIILLIAHFHFQNRVVTKVSKTRVKGVALYTVEALQ